MNKCKKISLIIVLVFAVTNVFANSNEYELTDVKEEYIGTYIPVDLELRLYQSKKFYESLRAARKYGATKPHDVLYLQKNICYSDVGFHDGYAIKNEEFASYKFITGKGGVFCIDDNGYLYRKISDADYGYTEYVEYVMKIILSNCSKSSEIKIEGQSIYIDNKKYEVNLDGAFFDVSNAVIWLFADGNYVLEKNGIDGELYTGKRYKDKVGNTKDVLVSRFSGLFELNPDEIPNYSEIPKEQLRLFRNLIFARHGYIFKNADLLNYFNSCYWYKQNPSFKESDMRKDEKDFISLMQKYENR